MATREVLSSANRGTGRAATISVRMAPESMRVRYIVRMTEAARQDTNNTVDFYLYGSDDTFVTRELLGVVRGWQGGTEIDKQGNTVPKGAPAVELELTPHIKELDILAEIETGAAFRYAVDCEDSV